MSNHKVKFYPVGNGDTILMTLMQIPLIPPTDSGDTPPVSDLILS